jgi:hypothetical protein
MLLDDVLMVITLAGAFLAVAYIRTDLRESRRLTDRHPTAAIMSGSVGLSSANIECRA